MKKKTSINTSLQEEKSIIDIQKFLIKLGWKLIRFPERTEGLDGIIEIYKNGRKAGDSIFVEIKTGKSYKKNNTNTADYFVIDLKDRKKIVRWKKNWENTPGPTMLIYVDYSVEQDSPKLWWADLKSKDTFIGENKTKINIPKWQYLSKEFEKNYKNLTDYKDYRSYDKRLPVINMKREDFYYLSLGCPMKVDARAYYMEWSKSHKTERTNPIFGEIIVNRVGWRHITRKERRTERIIQSFQLLSVAKKIITEIKDFKRIGKTKIRSSKEKNCIVKKEYFSLRAKVIFHHRYEAVVKVVIRKITETYNTNTKRNSERIWFYNVYEARRGKYKKATEH